MAGTNKGSLSETSPSKLWGRRGRERERTLHWDYCLPRAFFVQASLQWRTDLHTVWVTSFWNHSGCSLWRGHYAQPRLQSAVLTWVSGYKASVWSLAKSSGDPVGSPHVLSRRDSFLPWFLQAFPWKITGSSEFCTHHCFPDALAPSSQNPSVAETRFNGLHLHVLCLRWAGVWVLPAPISLLPKGLNMLLWLLCSNIQRCIVYRRKGTGDSHPAKHFLGDSQLVP